jgi:hypothetical protein
MPAPARNITAAVTPALSAVNDVVFTWVAPANVQSSTLEIGSSTGASDVLSTNVGTATTFDWHTAPVGNFFIRIRSTAGSTSLVSSELLLGVQSLKQVIEGLFFGAGPMASPVSAQASAGAVWLGSPRGASYQILVKSTISTSLVQQAVQQIVSATGNQFSATVTSVATLPASPGAHQIMIGDDLAICPSIIVPGETVFGITCSIRIDVNGFSSAVIGLTASGQFNAITVHELCHALLVAQHIQTPLGGQEPVMSTIVGAGEESISFSRYELAAIQAVYSSSISPFATRAQFKAAGLVE